MKRIFKYELDLDPDSSISNFIHMKDGAQILDCQFQAQTTKMDNMPRIDDKVCIWASVYEDALPVEMEFKLVMTGEEYDESNFWSHVKTLQYPSGLVGHVMVRIV